RIARQIVAQHTHKADILVAAEVNSAHPVKLDEFFLLVVRREDSPWLFPTDEILARRHAHQTPNARAGSRALCESVGGHGRRFQRHAIVLLDRIEEYIDNVLRGMRDDLSVTVRPSRQNWILFVTAPMDAVRRKANPHAAFVARLVFANTSRLPVGELK